jgi:hypothetical protein
MKPLALIAAIFLLLTVPFYAFGSTDGIYGLNKKLSYSWDGTNASLIAATSPDYDFAYGDETYVTYTLPQSWPSFTFYGQAYTQITADTNGNIWFGAAESTNSFTLHSTGPVIAAWNNDLSSYLNGGVFIQHKTDLPLGERIVIEWQAETYTDAGTILPSDFEVILFPNGDIRVDYKSFASTNSKDFGSGISSNDSTHNHYLSITSTYFPVYQLAGNSYGFTTSISTLQVSFSGTGGGIVTSTPDGIACNTNCSSTFPTGEQITLHPAADQYSTFGGWAANGVCTILDVDCMLTLSADKSATANFSKDTAHQVYLPNGNPLYYTTIMEAYGQAAEGSTIKTWATDYTGVVSIIRNPGITVTLQGGYDFGYSNQTGMTVLHGSLNISQGKVIVNGVAIR